MYQRRFFLFSVTFISLFYQTSSFANQSAVSQHEEKSDAQKVQEIFSILDQQMAGSDVYLEVIEEDVILMAHNVPVIEGREAYIEHIVANRGYGETVIEHQLVNVYSYDDIVIARGKAVGTFQGKGSDDLMSFQTKNVFIFRRQENGELRVWQTIFNMDP